MRVYCKPFSTTPRVGGPASSTPESRRATETHVVIRPLGTSGARAGGALSPSRPGEAFGGVRPTQLTAPEAFARQPQWLVPSMVYSHAPKKSHTPFASAKS